MTHWWNRRLTKLNDDNTSFCNLEPNWIPKCLSNRNETFEFWSSKLSEKIFSQQVPPVTTSQKRLRCFYKLRDNYESCLNKSRGTKFGIYVPSGWLKAWTCMDHFHKRRCDFAWADSSPWYRGQTLQILHVTLRGTFFAYDQSFRFSSKQH